MDSQEFTIWMAAKEATRDAKRAVSKARRALGKAERELDKAEEVEERALRAVSLAEHRAFLDRESAERAGRV